MDPIVSPWFIYLTFTLPKIGVISITCLVFLCICIIISAVYECITNSKNRTYNKDFIKIKWLRKKIVYFGLGILLMLSVFIPQKETIIAMFVADNITVTRLEKVLEVAKVWKNEAKKDAIDLINAVNKEKEKENAK